jgi:ParB family transcriptional regulator, chromosome partitioning protein
METNLKIQYIPLCNLDKSPLNARKTHSARGIEDMKASILAHGLINNLIVCKGENGNYLVAAGSRRLAALHALATEKKITDAYTVKCQVVSEQMAKEISLAENTVREAMHPADEFEAFKALIDEGMTPEQVAQRFGTEPKHVEKRLRLARCAQNLIEEYRAGKLTYDALAAFTITDDKKKQLQVYKSLPDWQKNNAHSIRSRLTDKMLSTEDEKVRFVGIEAYEKAGGKSHRDLFSNVTYVTDAALIEKLAAEKLDFIRKELMEKGWGWVAVADERDWSFTNGMGNITPVKSTPPKELLEIKKSLQKTYEELEEDESESAPAAMESVEAQIEALEAQIEAAAVYDPEEMKTAGCYVTIGEHGTAQVEYGLVKKADKRKAETIKSATKPDKGKSSNSDSDDSAGLTQALKDRLKNERMEIMQLALHSNPLQTMYLVVFTMALKLLTNISFSDCPDITYSQHKPTGKGGKAAKELEEARKHLQLEWIKEKSIKSRWQAFLRLTVEEKEAIMVYCWAITIPARLSLDWQGKPDSENIIEIALSELDFNMAQYWRPTADNYFSSITARQLLAIGTDIFGKQWAEKWKSAKKGELVGALKDAFAAPDKYKSDKDAYEKLTTWLPDGMAFLKPVKAKEAEEEKKPAAKAAPKTVIKKGKAA